MNKPEKVRELAQRIYIEMSGTIAGQDWQVLANAAIDAAEIFVDTFGARYGPNSQTH
jgi:hypothetical protein